MVAEAALDLAAKKGHWVILQVHPTLDPSWILLDPTPLWASLCGLWASPIPLFSKGSRPHVGACCEEVPVKVMPAEFFLLLVSSMLPWNLRLLGLSAVLRLYAFSYRCGKHVGTILVLTWRVHVLGLCKSYCKEVVTKDQKLPISCPALFSPPSRTHSPGCRDCDRTHAFLPFSPVILFSVGRPVAMQA